MKIQKTLRSLKNPSHINTIHYMFPETWLPYLVGSFLVTYLCHIREF